MRHNRPLKPLADRLLQASRQYAEDYPNTPMGATDRQTIILADRLDRLTDAVDNLRDTLEERG